LINPLFYCAKFREDFDFKVRYGIPLAISFLKRKKRKMRRKKKTKKQKKKK